MWTHPWVCRTHGCLRLMGTDFFSKVPVAKAHSPLLESNVLRYLEAGFGFRVGEESIHQAEMIPQVQAQGDHAVRNGFDHPYKRTRVKNSYTGQTFCLKLLRIYEVCFLLNQFGSISGKRDVRNVPFWTLSKVYMLSVCCCTDMTLT